MNAETPDIQVTRHRRPTETRRGFSMTELLVVIAVIAVLAGLLLVALGGVRRRALRTQTESTMQEFSKACDAFQIEHQRYPGLIPEEILAANPKISSTENALLELMGGGVRGDDPDYANLGLGQNWCEITIDNSLLGRLKVNLRAIGEGPRINGTPYAPYFTPGESELAPTAGQVGEGFCGAGPLRIPDLIDAWGQPILYVRRVRTLAGPLVGDPGISGPPPKFVMGGIRPYIDSTRLGEFGRNQTPAGGNQRYSILSTLSAGTGTNATFAQIIRHPSFGEPDEPLAGEARGAYFLDSAGPDGIFFSRVDGPGSPSEPVDNIVDDPVFGNPNVVKEYDDVRIFGGG